MKILKSLFFFSLHFLLILGLWQCRSLKSQEYRADSTSVIETMRAVPVKIEGQQVMYRYIIHCDEAGKAYIASGTGEKSKAGSQVVYEDYQKQAYNILSIDSNGVLTGAAGCDSLEAVIYAKDREIKTLRSQIIKETIEEKTAWYETGLGQFGITVLVIGAFAYIISRKFA